VRALLTLCLVPVTQIDQVEVPFDGTAEPSVRANQTGVTLTRVAGRPERLYRVDNIQAHTAVLLYVDEPNASSLVVVPLPGPPELDNYYGFRWSEGH
jgi:hypothetical protein